MVNNPCPPMSSYCATLTRLQHLLQSQYGSFTVNTSMGRRGKPQPLQFRSDFKMEMAVDRRIPKSRDSIAYQSHTLFSPPSINRCPSISLDLYCGSYPLSFSSHQLVYSTFKDGCRNRSDYRVSEVYFESIHIPLRPFRAPPL